MRSGSLLPHQVRALKYFFSLQHVDDFSHNRWRCAINLHCYAIKSSFYSVCRSIIYYIIFVCIMLNNKKELAAVIEKSI